MSNPNEERLQKVMARAGIASRRACEDLISAGRVKVNGKVVTQLGTKVDVSHDEVTVDDAPIYAKNGSRSEKIYLMLNKPAGYLSTVSDPQGRETILDLIELPEGQRLYPVGRLDADTKGLILLTNDGTFANALTHPKHGVEKEYVVLLDGIVAMKDLVRLRNGVEIPVEDTESGEKLSYKTKPAKAELIRHEGSNSLVKIIITEGKKRQVRLMADAIEHPVIELKRVRLGQLKLADLPEGKSRKLSKAEIAGLLEVATTPQPEEKPARAAGATRQTEAKTTDERRPARGGEALSSRPAARGGDRTRSTSGRPARPGGERSGGERSGRSGERGGFSRGGRSETSRPVYGRAFEADNDSRRDNRSDSDRGERRPFRSSEGGERSFRPRDDGERRPFRSRDEGAGSGERSFRPRDDGERSFRPRDDGERRPFRPRDDGERDNRPGSDRGERRPFRSRDEGGERRPAARFGGSAPRRQPWSGPGSRTFRPDDSFSSDRGERRPFRSSEGGERRSFGGGRPSGGGERSFRPRDEGGERRPFRPRDEGGENRPFRSRDEGGERRPFRSSEGGERRPFRSRDEGGERGGSSGERRPFRSGGSSFGGGRPSGGGERRSFGGGRPSGDGERRSFGGGRPSGGGERRSFGGGRPGGGFRGPRSDDAGGERRPFRPREEGSSDDRGERRDRPRSGGFRPGGPRPGGARTSRPEDRRRDSED